jgi:branched-chain amino acid transport system ATP-binding protein
LTALLEVDALDVALGGVPVLSDVSLTVGRGEIVALLGRNGAGKTTTLRAVAGAQRIAAGRVLLEGDDITGRPAHRVSTAGCVLVLEGHRVFRRQDVETNLRLGALHAPGGEVAQRLTEQFGRFAALAARRRTLAGRLSGGEQQLLAIAQGLMARPRLLLLDEPSVGLDGGMVERLFAILGGLRAQGIGLLVAEQSVDHLLAVADRAYVIASGRVVAERPARVLRADGVLREAYLGRPPARSGAGP